MRGVRKRSERSQRKLAEVLDDARAQPTAALTIGSMPSHFLNVVLRVMVMPKGTGVTPEHKNVR